jgi:BirA family transcriptional regulator, biotin operon repressor / biotin---[acetyl-CoA-carboxylase] ligase
VSTPLPARPHLDLDRIATRSHHDVIWRERLASTNAELAARGRAGFPEYTVVVAEEQTSGRGRLDRTWSSPPGAGLTFSVLWWPRAPIASWTWLPLLAGVSVASVLERYVDDVTLKWPNDVLLGGRKAGGILVELAESTHRSVVVTGVGLNVSTTAEELPVAAATSLALAGVEVDRTDLLIELLVELRTEYAGWNNRRTPELIDRGLRDRYATLCPTVRGERVRVELPTGEVVRGIGSGLGDDGSLQVTTGAGVRTFRAGDVVHARAPTDSMEE